MNSINFIGQRSPEDGGGPACSYVSELYAQTIAYLFTVQQYGAIMLNDIPIVILYDNTSACQSVDYALGSDYQAPLAEFASALKMWATVAGARIHTHHIKSHTNINHGMSM